MLVGSPLYFQVKYTPIHVAEGSKAVPAGEIHIFEGNNPQRAL